MIRKIEFLPDRARVFIEVDVERVGIIDQLSTYDQAERFPTVAKIRALLPDLVREIAPGFMDQENR